MFLRGHTVYKHRICLQKSSDNTSLVPVGNACFLLFIFDDKFCARIDPHSSPPSALALATQSNKHGSLLWNPLQHGDWLACIWPWWAPGPEKFTSWNYLRAPSYSVFIVLSRADAARPPGWFSWLRWLLVAEPPLATSLSAPSSSVFIVSGSGAGADKLAAALSAAAWASVCLSLLHFL